MVAGHIVVLAGPPDARYAPLAPPLGAPRRFPEVRALAFPLEGAQMVQVPLSWPSWAAQFLSKSLMIRTQRATRTGAHFSGGSLIQ